jgi:hypothetical protein
MEKILMVGLVIAGLLGIMNVHAMSIADFDGNDITDAADVDLLTTEIVTGTNDPLFDVNNDLVVDLGDLDEWFPIYSADNGGVPSVSIARVDINFDTSNTLVDFLVIQNNQSLTSSLFTSGDINADGVVNNLDITRYLSLGGVVPIPPALWLFGTGLLGLVGMATRKKAS